MRRPAPLLKVLVGTLVLGAALTGCVRVPDAGPVVVAAGKGQANPIEGPFSDPRPPQAGASPQAIVQGFLDAMTATPVQTTAAKQFLTKSARASWHPQRIIAYTDITNPRGSDDVSVRLSGADRIGIRGNWQGSLPVADRLMSFPMALVHDEWRIAKAPNALVVPKQSFFETAYQRANLYFFDPTGRILVPEPVYVPSGAQLAGALVQSLLQGPDPDLANVERSFLPPGRALALSVLVTKAGLAEIALKGAPGPLSGRTRQLLLAQLAWTLRQAPAVHTFSLTIGGREVTDGSGSAVFGVDTGAPQYDPRQNLASAPLWALKRGLLVSGPASGLTKTDGQFGTTKLGIGAFAISLDGLQVAATAPGQLLLAPVQGGDVTRVYGSSGSHFLRPSWDFDGRLWAVEDTPSGARVLWVRNGHRHQLVVPGVTGQHVKEFLVSRDGSRLVSVLRGHRADRIVINRIAYDVSGRPLSATPAKKLSWLGAGSPRVRDIGWVSPTAFMVIHLYRRDISEVRTIAVDGSTSEENVTTTTIPRRLIGLATSPGGDRSYALTRHQLIDLSQVNHTADVPYKHLHHITYAG